MGNAPEFGQGERVLTRAAGMVAEARADFEGHAKTLDGQITGVRNRWGGAGASAFFILHQAWTEKHKVVVTALDKFAADLTDTERDNTRVDEEAGAFMNNLINKLGQVQG